MWKPVDKVYNSRLPSWKQDLFSSSLKSWHFSKCKCFTQQQRFDISFPPGLPRFSHFSNLPLREESNLCRNNLIHHLFRLTFQTGSEAGCHFESHSDRHNSKATLLIPKSVKRLQRNKRRKELERETDLHLVNVSGIKPKWRAGIQPVRGRNS